MHEFSIASALLELVLQHTPAGATVQAIEVEAGPMRGVDGESLELAWSQTALGTPAEGAKLKLHLPPWTLHCPKCQKEWKSEELYVSCECGCDMPHPVGGDELRLVSVTVSDS